MLVVLIWKVPAVCPGRCYLGGYPTAISKLLKAQEAQDINLWTCTRSIAGIFAYDARSRVLSALQAHDIWSLDPEDAGILRGKKKHRG